MEERLFLTCAQPHLQGLFPGHAIDPDKAEELKLESHLQLQFELGGDSSCRKFTILDSKSLKMVEENGWRLLVFSTAIGPLEMQEPANVKPKEYNPRGLLNLVIQRFLNILETEPRLFCDTVEHKIFRVKWLYIFR